MKRLAGAVVALGFLACAGGPGELRIDEAWAWPTVSGPTAAYVTIVNGTAEEDRLIGARSTCCRSIEIHRTEIDGDRMRMSPATDGIAVAVGDTVTLEPGGHHLMLFEPVEPLRVGEHFELTLIFEDAGELAVEAAIRR